MGLTKTAHRKKIFWFPSVTVKEVVFENFAG
jgi:hypothetical protein